MTSLCICQLRVLVTQIAIVLRLQLDRILRLDRKALRDKASQSLRAKMSSKSKTANSWKGLYEEQELLKWVKRGKKIREGAGQEAGRQEAWVFFSNIS